MEPEPRSSGPKAARLTDRPIKGPIRNGAPAPRHGSSHTRPQTRNGPPPKRRGVVTGNNTGPTRVADRRVSGRRVSRPAAARLLRTQPVDLELQALDLEP